MIRRAAPLALIALIAPLLLAGCKPKNTPNAAVVGVNKAELYPDEKLAGAGSDIPAGTALTVTAVRGKALQATTADGKAGWVRRFVACTPEEFKRRKAAGEVPETFICLGSDKGGMFVYGGGMSISNGEMVASNMQAFWLDDSMRGKTFTVASNELVGDPDVLYLLKDSEIKKLAIWTAPTPK